MLETTKQSTACNEVLRRLKNHSVEVNKAEVELCLRTYMDNLAGMGFNKEWRETVLKTAITKYKKVMELVDQGKTVRNRFGSSTMIFRT